MEIELNFEKEEKKYKVKLKESKTKEEFKESIKECLKECDFLQEDQIHLYFPYNPLTNFYFSSYDAISRYQKKEIEMKNCSTDSKGIVQFLMEYDYSEFGKQEEIVDMRCSLRSTSHMDELKKILTKLKYSLDIDIFAEEYIEYGGINYLVDAVKNTEGNTKVYATEALKALFKYESSMQYVSEHNEVLRDLYEILIEGEKFDNSNLVSHTLSIFVSIASFFKETFCNDFIKMAEDYARETNTIPFKQMVNYINHSIDDIKENAFFMINLLLFSRKEDSKKSSFLFELKDAGIISALEKNVDFNGAQFQKDLQYFQTYTNEIINGSAFQVELYRKKIKSLEDKLHQTQRDVEMIYLNRYYYEKLIDDYVNFKKLAKANNSLGGYFDPDSLPKDYSYYLGQKLEINTKNGFSNVREIIQNFDDEEKYQLRNQLRDYQETQNNYKLTLNELNLLKNNLHEKALKRLEQENDFKKVIEDLENKVKEKEEKIAQLEKTIEECNYNNEYLQNTITEDQSKIEEQDKNIEIIMKLAEDFQVENANFKESISDLENQNYELQNKIAEYENEIYEKDQKIAEYDEEIKKLAAEQKEQDIEKNEDKQNMEEILRLAEEIQNENTTLKAQIEQLEQDKADLINGNDENSPLLKQISDLENKIMELNISIEEKDKQISFNAEQNEEDKKNLETLLKLSEDFQVENDKLKEKIAKLEADNKKLKEFKENTPLQQTLKNYEEKISGLKEKIKDKERKLSISETQIKELLMKQNELEKKEEKKEEEKKDDITLDIPLPPINLPIPPLPPGSELTESNDNNIPVAPPIPGIPIPPALNSDIPLAPPIPGVPLAPPIPGVPLAPPIPGVPLAPNMPGLPNIGFPIQMGPPKPQPTKPKLQLKAKFKQLNWKRILVFPKEVEDRKPSIWNDMEEEKVDIDEIISKFEVKKIEPKEKKEEDNKKPEKKRFLTGKRIQEISIASIKWPKLNALSSALLTMEEGVLSKDQLLSINKNFITSEELEAYHSMGEDGEWEKTDMFLIKLNEIPYCKIKTEIWSKIIDVKNLIPNTKDRLEFLIPACKELKDNKRFKQILSNILAIGNVINGGSAKGQADGFNLDILKNLSSIKGNKNNSILQWVCENIQKKDEDFSEIKNEFPNLLKASQYAESETNKSIQELKGLSNQINKNLATIEIEDEFVRKTKKELEVFKKETEEIEETNTKNMDYYKETIEFFGYDKKDSCFEAPEELFKMLIAFFGDVERNIPKRKVAKKVFNRKNEVGKQVDTQANKDELFELMKCQIKNKKD